MNQENDLMALFKMSQKSFSRNFLGTKARKMISPFTKEEITVAAKPAKTVVKVQPLRGLKVMVE